MFSVVGVLSDDDSGVLTAGGASADGVETRKDAQSASGDGSHTKLPSSSNNVSVARHVPLLR